MKKTWVAVAVAACCAPGVAMAQKGRPAAIIDGYYVSAEIEFEGDVFDDDVEVEGDGFGVKGRFDLTDTLFLAGEYQANEYDEVEGFDLDEEIQLDTLRAGLGLRFANNSPFYVLGEVISADIETGGSSDDEIGFGAHLGVDAPIATALSLYGQVGYISVDEVLGDGFEFLGGLAFMITPTIGAFADYRHTEVEDDDDAEASIGDIRVGIRFALR